jgi:polyphosphate:AMP phosphotransferase
VLEAAELGSRVDKDEYDEVVPGLRVELLNLQFDLRSADFSVLLMIGGDDRLGVDDLVDVLHEWLDARYMDTEIFLEDLPEEEGRPRFWRYWRVLPATGRIGLQVGAWPMHALRDRVRGDIDDDAFARRVAQGRAFERLLDQDGTLVVKLWLHLPRKQHKKRLKDASADEKRGVLRAEEAILEWYDDVVVVAEKLLADSSTAAANWILIESTDARHRNLVAGRAIRDAITTRMANGPPTSPIGPKVDAPDVLGGVDLSASLSRSEYKHRRAELQVRLRELTYQAREARRSAVLVFEGWDAAGKGGCIRRITQPMNAWDYRVVPIAAPTDEERAHHYLWRFWRHLPRPGRMIVFDRSWYGRVLVERVEGLASDAEWQRAYAEIHDFESQLNEAGIPVLKFFLHIDPDEQLRRFQAREQTPYKKYKLTDDDYRNRDRWDDYVKATNEMITRTSTPEAAWHLVAANDKRWARTQVLQVVCDAYERMLG